MLKEKETVLRRFLLAVDVVIVALAYLFAYALSHFGGQNGISLGEHAVLVLMGALLWTMTLYANDIYGPMRTRSYPEVLWAIAKSAFISTLAFGTFVFMLKLMEMRRLFFTLFAVLSALFILLEKTILFLTAHYFRQRGLNTRRLLVVGTGKRATEFVKKADSHPEWGFEILGAIDDEPGRGVQKVGRLDVVGTLEDIPRIFHNDAVDEVVFVVPRSRLNALQETIHNCETEGVVVTVTVDLFDTKLAKSSVTELDGLPLLHFKTTHAREWQLLVKRIFDFSAASFLILILSPVLLLFAILIKMTSKGPVFFKQTRLGLAGRKFTLYKFRTMKLGAHDVLSQVTDLNEMTTPEFQKKKKQWITPVGRLMRKLSIDEFPQLLNVFVGHMSFVGPRPTVPDEVDKYKAWQRRRFSMKPGITCLWQVNGRNNVAFEEWMKLDLEYLDNWSLWLDVKILAKTVPVVLFGIGAY